MRGQTCRPHRPKLCHFAAKIRADGAVSPLCAKKPRALDLTQSTWTLRREAVTCPRCLALNPPASALVPRESNVD